MLGRIVWAGVVGVIILAISVVAAVGIGHLTSHPIRQLEEGARKVRTSGFSDVEPLRPSRILEIDETVKSFNQMVDGLRERERIRDLFGKYVPSRIAERLLSHDEDLAPHSSEATILFVDLADFSSLTERLGPSGTVTLLNEYFELAVSTLEKYGAIVTQFQGDAILATFNVPVPQPGHATLAIDAGIELLEGVAARRFSGQRLRCRIGISTGPVISGNVGAPGRLNYTVHGDAVNLAARLEELNKTYGRHLLVSAATVERAEDRGLIKIDTVSIRGRYQQVEVYGLKDDTLSTNLKT